MDIKDFKKTLIDESKAIEELVIDIRRHIHMYPETKFEEEQTAAFIEAELQKIGYETQRTAKTGVIATFKGLKKGKTVALRADIDALDITEEVNVPFRSKNEGKMHACGHDAHTAMLLGAARVIYKYKDHFIGNLKLIFQPGEEGGGGAQKITEEGHLDDVDIIFGLHISAKNPSGMIRVKKGPAMASSDSFTLAIKGKGGHAASPHLTIDPIAVSVDIYNAFQKIITREIDPFISAVITIPMLRGSNAYNVIPSEVTLTGTLRAFDLEIREYIIKRMKEIVQGYSQAWRCEGQFKLNKIPYPPLINDGTTVDKIIDIFGDLDTVTAAPAVMGSEDFAFYLQKTQGAFFFLGTQNEEQDCIYPHHHPRFKIDESVLWKGTAMYSLVGFYYLFSEES
ncbi:MAG: M20 family metallopeptidase [Promethearchaeota archaeon]